MMQRQYWVTKKSVSRKLGGKEDDCIVSSDAELDAKLELFKSINESCLQLQRILELFQEKLCYLAQEENCLGRYLKECAKSEKNACAGQIMSTAGKALSYTGHQRLTIRPPVMRLHHEVETFRGRAVTDTKSTVVEMEKARTEYRAALSWMKSASSQLDPDTGLGLEKFRKTQSYVKSAKIKFDKLTLACLQKVDLLAAARCNMFSHVLVPYLSAFSTFSTKVAETLALAASKLESAQAYDCACALPLTLDKDKSTFFNSEYTDAVKNDDEKNKSDDKPSTQEQDTTVSNLLGEDFSAPDTTTMVAEESSSSSAMLDLQWPTSSDFTLNGNFMPSNLIQEGNFNFDLVGLSSCESNGVEAPSQPQMGETANGKSSAHVSWLSLFAELDPLGNYESQQENPGDRA